MRYQIRQIPRTKSDLDGTEFLEGQDPQGGSGSSFKTTTGDLIGYAVDQVTPEISGAIESAKPGIISDANDALFSESSPSVLSPGDEVVVEREGVRFRVPVIEQGWKDLIATVGGAQVPPQNAPSADNFGPAHTPQRREFAFSVNDYVFMQPFHVNHDISPGAEAYLHVHWSTNGTSTGLVRWELTYSRALGHNQANFGDPETIFVEEAASGTAWRHMVTETTTPIILTEPDEIILVTLRRVAPTSGSNGDTVFALMVDLHYQSDRDTTPQKAPDFYTP